VEFRETDSLREIELGRMRDAHLSPIDRQNLRLLIRHMSAPPWRSWMRTPSSEPDLAAPEDDRDGPRLVCGPLPGDDPHHLAAIVDHRIVMVSRVYACTVVCGDPHNIEGVPLQHAWEAARPRA